MARKKTATTSPPATPPRSKAPARSKPKPTTRSSPAATDGPELDPRERAARALEAKAEGGDVAAIKAMADGVSDRLRGVDRGRDRDQADELPPHVAAAAIRAALGDAAATPAPTFVAKVECPLCHRWFDADVATGTGQVTHCRPQGT